jgi:hypothetical protein
MKATWFYRIAALLLLLFAAAHSFGFSQTDASLDAVVGPMRSVEFDVMGSRRTFWDLFLAAGYSVGALYVFAAILAWQLGGAPAETLARMRVSAWAFALCFALLTLLSWRFLFILPVIFAGAITLCLTLAALAASRI